jgi:predicted TPR repeat methyltransferase
MPESPPPRARPRDRWRDALSRVGIFDPDNWTGARLAAALAAGGERLAALSAYRELAADTPDDPALLEAFATLLARLGRDEEERAVRTKRARLTVDGMGLTLGEQAPALAFELALAGAGPVPSGMPGGYVAALFDSFAPDFDAMLRGALHYRAPELVFAALSAALERHEGLRTERLDICDVGCGTGLLGPLLRPLARRLEGVDLSEKMLEKARVRGCYDELFAAELHLALAVRADRYDVVSAADVFNYLGELAPALSAAAGALRPGGLVVFTVEHSDEPGYRLGDTGRYRHAAAFVREAAATAGLSELSVGEGVLRSEQAHPVMGLIWVFRRGGQSPPAPGVGPTDSGADSPE